APQKVRDALTALGLLPLFTPELVLLSGEVHEDKSTPAIFRSAVALAGETARPASCMFVGDDTTERRTARRAGMQTRRSLELRRIGPTGFEQVMHNDPRRVSSAGLMFDIAQAILQNGEGFERIATDAFEEVVSDLYDGFLSAQDRAGMKMPDEVVLAPLVKW